MNEQDNPNSNATESARAVDILPSLPNGSRIQQITFTAERAATSDILIELPAPIRRFAVVVSEGATTGQSLPADDLLLLTLPVDANGTLDQLAPEVLAKVTDWVETPQAASGVSCLTMTFQGARILWAPGRLAILAVTERLASVRAAVLEATYYESELRDIEQSLGELWPTLEAHMPHSFEFKESSIGEREQLRKQSQQILMLRARLARIAPHAHAPYVYPPTLASQIGERLRERTRMPHRQEFLSEQLEVFEEVYEMCGQRASDFMLARSGHILEWIIIILLVAQLVLSGFEILTSAGT